jgi:hypothetical protein
VSHRAPNSLEHSLRHAVPPERGALIERLRRRQGQLMAQSEAEGGAKPVRLCPCSSDLDLFRYRQGIIDLNAQIPDSALDLCMSKRVGFILRISFLIENQRPSAHRSVLAVAMDRAGR